MKVELIAHTTYPLAVCEEAAAMCTQSSKPAQALRGAIRSGHESVLEHAVFTFRIEGISRVTLAQLTRHRIASFSVLSQRYVNQLNKEERTPTSIGQDQDLDMAYQEHMVRSELLYNKLIVAGVPKEDARYVLPQSITTDLIMTMNARELGHLFSLRCCNRAQWEIREMADQMLTILVNKWPELFGQCGPGCVRGHCPEKRPCGHPRKPEDWRGVNGNEA